MNSREHSSTRSSFWGMVPAAVVVAVSIAACNSDPTNASTYNPNDPACTQSESLTCSQRGSNCGNITDSCGRSIDCGRCAGVNNACTNNRCQRSCVSDAECGGTSRCTNGSCSQDDYYSGTNSYRCTTNTECQAGQTCYNGYCSGNATTQTCRYTTDCPSGQSCNNGYCSGAYGSSQTCYYQTDCPSGQTCNSGYCSGAYGTTPGTQTCRYATDCPSGQTCNNGYCSGQYGSTQTCRYSTDCPSGQTCGTNGYCSGSYNPGYPNGGNYGTCRYNSDCASGQYCGSNGYCSGGGYGSGGQLRAQCITSGFSLFGVIDVYSDTVLYSSQYPGGVRVDSCICQNGVMRTQVDSSYGGYQDIWCSRCVKDGSDRYCYQ